MNSLVVLLMATAATGADPQPVAQQTVNSGTTYTYTEAAPENRPGLIGRIRNALSPKSSTPSVQGSPYPPVGGTQVWGAAVPVAPSVVSSEKVTAPTPRFVPSGSSPEPPLADATPVTTAAPPVEPRVEPRPATQQPTVSVPTNTYPAPTETTTAEPNRPRFFSRVRKLFGSSSGQPSQGLPVDTISPASQQAPVGKP
jgi:hypothetical protein